ncbi:response regulator [Alteromonas sp. RKMC-009]|uniref:response regulator n=1 Tax=Alteromonas sp. RKMC-009 TaxID=2267264 RepID=UPI000E69277E|nr:response regulator transcription factor [Alteromonas sp. RKMC-009]AYA66179.1 response regulator transcription factor [Alteromonas sp. RKMC-009]MEC7691368.1 response regulator transcription factor [Pseudomonadota bacterium]
MINVAIADDQILVRQGIASLLSLRDDITITWQADNGEEALTKLDERPVDILLIDIRMPVKNGIETVKALRQAQNNTPVIVLTTFDDPALFTQAMHAGANGFLLKDVDTAKLHDAIDIVHQGGMLAEPVLLNQLSDEQLSTFADPNIEPLSERELDILKLIAGGYSNKEIADTVFLAEGTVKNHVSNILAKLHTRDRTRAVLKALSAQLI